MQALTSAAHQKAAATKSDAVPRAARIAVSLFLLIVIMVVAGFSYISSQEHSLGEARDGAKQMRMASQSLMEVNTTILDALAVTSGRLDTTAYDRALDRLNTHPSTHFPLTIMVGPREAPTQELLSALRSAWAGTAALIERGEIDNARAAYIKANVSTNMKVVTAGIESTLNEQEAAYSLTHETVERITLFIVALQVVAGIVCVYAFVVAARSGMQQSNARASAVRAADASREQVSRLFEMTDMLQSAADHADANAVLRSTAAELIPGFGGALYVFSNSRDRLVLSTYWDIKGAVSETIALHECWAMKRGKPQINRPGSHKLCCPHHETGDFALEIPMVARGEILGLLQIHAQGENAEQRLEAITGLGSALTDAMSLALSNIALREKLRSQALRDPLTGLYNRRYMEDALQRVTRLAERDRHEVSIIMIDLDHFKRLNDRHGHAKGDAVLRDTASAIIGLLRESDVACRYGGEELIVVLPNCGLKLAAGKAERMRIAIKALSEPDGLDVSASFGVASIPVTSSTTKELLAHADAALYAAKQAGRDRVVCAPEMTEHQLAEIADEASAQTVERLAAE